MWKSLTKVSLKNTKACLFLLITPSPYKDKQNEEIVAGFAKSTKWDGGACVDLTCWRQSWVGGLSGR